MIPTLSCDRPESIACDGAGAPMRALQARSIEAAFLQALAAGTFRGRVHSKFRRVVNIESETGKLFTLAASPLDNAPDTAIIDVARFDFLGISPNDPVVAKNRALHVGDGVVMRWAAARVWRAELPRFSDAHARLSSQLQRSRAYLEAQGVACERFHAAAAGTPFDRETCNALAQRSALLLRALAQSDHASARRHAESMIGLGPGLTPSGDDFLVGLFAVLNLVGSPCYGFLGGGKDVLAYAERSTNAISLAAMKGAADGRVRESVARLIGVLISGPPDMLTRSLDQVLAIGSTSGADMIAGILAGLELNLDAEAAQGRASESQRPVVAAPKDRSAPHTELGNTGARQQ